MNRKNIGFRTEAGPNVSANIDSGASAGEAKKTPVSRLNRAKLGTALLLGSLIPPSEKAIRAALDEENRDKVVRSEMDIDTGAITEVKGDGSRRIIEAGSQPVPESFRPRDGGFSGDVDNVSPQTTSPETKPHS